MKNKKIIILVSIGLLILLFAVVLIFKQSQRNKVSETPGTAITPVFQADYLSQAEKQKLELPAETKVQALKRNTQGEVMVYKIIRTDKDITNPNDIAPISPRIR